MDTPEPLAPLGGDEFAPAHTYLNTAACGLLPRRTADAVRRFTGQNAAGGPDGIGSLDSVAHARELFARLAGVGPDRVAIGAAVSVHVSLIAGSLPVGAEVLVPEGEFSSLVSPFAVRRDLKTRTVPLEELADAIRPGTALVAFSAVQSADGRTADLAAIRAAAAAHGTRTLLDATQSAGWLPLDAGAYDYTVTGAYKFLLCPRGATFLTVSEEAQESLVPLHAGWFAGEEVYDCYGPVSRFPPTARRFDEGPVLHAYEGAEQSLELILELGVDAIHAHDTALAARFREGVAALGYDPSPKLSASLEQGAPPSADSAIVAVPGLGERRAELAEAGVLTSARAGNLRVAFHLYNSSDDVERALRALRMPAG